LRGVVVEETGALSPVVVDACEWASSVDVGALIRTEMAASFVLLAEWQTGAGKG
jgi:hypothetical protein